MILSPTVGNRHRKRHPDRPDILLHWNRLYREMRVQTGSGPLIVNYLETLYRVMNQALHSNSRVLAVRIDLHYPDEMPVTPHHAGNFHITQWLWHLNWELHHAWTKYPHNIRYVWCREQHKSEKHHYHVLLLFNANAYFCIGDISPSESGCYDANNLYHRIVRAWCKAIDWPPEKMKGLVHAAKTKQEQKQEKKKRHWIILRDAPASFADVFYAASYLCKVFSKPLVQRIHCFDGSRR